MIAMYSYYNGIDPILLDDHEDFRPDKWLPKEVEARKGTHAAYLDHIIFAGASSQEAMRCPGFSCLEE
jgi:hypothetical protein